MVRPAFDYARRSARLWTRAILSAARAGSIRVCAVRCCAALAIACDPAHRAAEKEPSMADLYLKALESERRQLWATCRLKGLAKDTPERQRIAAIDAAIAAHKAKGRVVL
ncbi:MAG: hypothetical protein C0510_07985 [Erythrobacter sp.]|nr:hypothetical protein [Erythrobacter sp.]